MKEGQGGSDNFRQEEMQGGPADSATVGCKSSRTIRLPKYWRDYLSSIPSSCHQRIRENNLSHDLPVTYVRSKRALGSYCRSRKQSRMSDRRPLLSLIERKREATEKESCWTDEEKNCCARSREEGKGRFPRSARLSEASISLSSIAARVVSRRRAALNVVFEVKTR